MASDDCPGCGAAVVAGARRCPRCGAEYRDRAHEGGEVRGAYGPLDRALMGAIALAVFVLLVLNFPASPMWATLPLAVVAGFAGAASVRALWRRHR